MASSVGRILPSQRWGVWFSSTLSTLLPSHEHDCPELNLIMSGDMVYRIQGHSTPLEGSAGQLIVLPANVHHELVRSSEDLALWVIELNAARKLDWMERAQVSTPDPEWRKGVLERTRRLWLRPGRAETLRTQEELWEALRDFRVGPAVPPRRVLHPAVVRAKSVCERAVDGTLDVTRLAKEVGLSASRLAHLFAEQVGVTPLQYRNFARVQHFVRTYNGDERNLTRAAFRSGFGSYAQFHRVFWQVCGEAPAVHFKWLAETAEIDAQRTLGDCEPQLAS